MRFASLLLAGVLVSSATFAVAAPTLPVDDRASLDSPFTVSSHTQVPGKTLKPGSYTITIKDHLADRLVLQVSDGSGKAESTFLGVYRSDLLNENATGPIRMPLDKSGNALLGFTFPGGRSVEFVYPKEEAAKLVTKSSGEVLAIDPASDNLHTSGKNLSHEDAQVVTLWSLQIAPLTNGQKGVAAKKYTSTDTTTVASSAAPTTAQQTSATPTETVPSRTSQPAYTASRQSSATQPTATRTAAKRPAPNADTQSASNHLPALKALPHTASNMPLLLLVAMSSLGAAATLRLRRVGETR